MKVPELTQIVSVAGSRFAVAFLAIAVALPLAVRAGDAAVPPADAPQRAACDLLKLADFGSVQDAPTRISDSGVVEASGETPAACVIRGYVAPQVGFEMKLPLSGWNGKLLELGSGGFAGSIQVGGDRLWCDEGVRRGYVCIHSDYGHTAGITEKSIAALDGTWAYNNLQAEVDYGYRGIHVVGQAAKAIAKRFYGSAHQRAYFLGCSNGGRQAMVAAQRYPWDFDGIVAMEPAINLSGAFNDFLYNYRAVTDADNKPLFNPADLELLHKSAVAQCDLDDGVKDNVIGNPSVCKFDPVKLLCAKDKADDCLTPAQVAAAKKVYAGPQTAKGRMLYRGHTMPGAERGSFGFAVTRPLAQLALTDFFRFMAFVPDAGPAWKLTDADADEDYKRLSTMEALYESNNPDLRPFKEAGGKLIMVQGWDDSGTPFPLNTIDYYQTMSRTVGGDKAASDFARLFMVAGREHCAGGEGASVADFLNSLEAWVEQGSAPDMIKAYHIDKSDNPVDALREPGPGVKIKFSRPLYPYPLQAKYKGSGDENDYRSFKPVNLSEIHLK